MKLSRAKLLKGCLHTLEVEELLIQAERVLKTWEPVWTAFLSAPVREEALEMFNEISDIGYFSSGGFPSAERQRVLIHPKQISDSLNPYTPFPSLISSPSFSY